MRRHQHRVTRACPSCGREQVLSRKEAERVYQRDSRTRLRFKHNFRADYCCSSCGAVFEKREIVEKQADMGGD